MDKLTVDFLVALSGAGLSLLAFYLPPFKRFMASIGEYKFTFMAVFLLAVAAVYQIVWCDFAITCFKTNLFQMLLVWLGALGVNQGTYQEFIKKQKK